MADADAEEVIDDGAQGIQDAGGVTAYAQRVVIGGSLRAVAIALVSLILSAGALFLRPIRAFVDGVSRLITGTFGGPVLINEAGALASAGSFTDGVGALLGPFAWPFAVTVSMIGVFVFIWFLRKIPLSPTKIFTGRGN